MIALPVDRGLLFHGLDKGDYIVEISAADSGCRLHLALPIRDYLLHVGGALAQRLDLRLQRFRHGWVALAIRAVAGPALGAIDGLPGCRIRGPCSRGAQREDHTRNRKSDDATSKRSQIPSPLKIHAGDSAQSFSVCKLGVMLPL